MTIDDFARAIEKCVRDMQAEQMRTLEAAVAAGLDPEILLGVMNAILAKVEREAQAA